MSRLQVIDKQTQSIRVAFVVVVVFGLVILATRLTSPESMQESIRGVMAATCWLAVWPSVVLARSWIVAARVLRARQVPTVLWRQWMRESWISACQVWGVLALGLVGVALTVYSPWPWVTAYGLAALVICLASPGLFAWLMRRWRNGPPRAIAFRSGFAFPRPLKALKAWGAQYTALTGWNREMTLVPNGARPARWYSVIAYWPMLLNGAIFAHPLGSTATVFQAWMMGFLVLFTSTTLVCKNLHWRMLLAPGGMYRGRLGWHIAFSTATVFTLVLIAGIGIGLLVASFFLAHPLQFVLDFLAKFAALPFELIFAICVGTLIRGARYPMRWFAALIAVWMVVGVIVFIGVGSSFGSFMQAPAVIVDLPYLLSLLVLAALVLWASNKLWTVERLMQSAS